MSTPHENDHDQARAAVTAGLWSASLLAAVAAIAGCASLDSSEPRASETRAEALYAENCASCHGRAGDGRGPMATWLEVRPRNFRDEDLRYVSAPGGPPTDADLIQTIRRGRTIGQMPGFPYLDHDDAQLLVDYIRDLRQTGIAAMLVEEFADDGEITPEEIAEIAEERVAPGEPIDVRGPGADFRPHTARGRALYMDNCASCHGPGGRGDGLDLPKDDRGNPIEVRDLTSGRFNGGTHPIEVFKRIRCGLPGTPMPEASAIQDDDVWHLVNYVELLAGRR